LHGRRYVEGARRMNPKDYLKSLITGMEIGSSIPVKLSELKLLLMFMELAEK
jgi:hypothetical protein